MWQTSRGERTLQAAEAELVARAIDTMVDALLMHIDVDWVDEPGVCQTGIDVFDRLSPSQRISLLHELALHLLSETASSPTRTAATDGAVAAVFVEVRDQVNIEIELFEPSQDSPERRPWRERVLRAGKQMNDPLVLPDPSCRDMSRWEEVIRSLSDSVLSDRDFEMAQSFSVADPDAVHRQKLMGIDQAYFTCVPDEPPAYEAMRLASVTRDLVRGKPK